MYESLQGIDSYGRYRRIRCVRRLEVASERVARVIDVHLGGDRGYRWKRGRIVGI